MHFVASDFDAPICLELGEARADCGVHLRAVVNEFIENHGSDLRAAVNENTAIEAPTCVRGRTWARTSA